MYLKMKREMKTMEKYVCDVCGWEYDEEIGKDQFSNTE